MNQCGRTGFDDEVGDGSGGEQAGSGGEQTGSGGEHTENGGEPLAYKERRQLNRFLIYRHFRKRRGAWVLGNPTFRNFTLPYSSFCTKPFVNLNLCLNWRVPSEPGGPQEQHTLPDEPEPAERRGHWRRQPRRRLRRILYRWKKKIWGVMKIYFPFAPHQSSPLFEHFNILPGRS